MAFVCVCDFQRVRTVKTEIWKHFSRFFSSFLFVVFFCARRSLQTYTEPAQSTVEIVSSITTKYNACYRNWFLCSALAITTTSSSFYRLFVSLFSLFSFSATLFGRTDGQNRRTKFKTCHFIAFCFFTVLVCEAMIATILLSTGSHTMNGIVCVQKR